MKKFKFSSLDKSWKSYTMAGCTCILFFVVITHLGLIFGYIGDFFEVFTTVFIGAIIAYILNPVAVFFRNKVFKNIKKENVRWSLSVIVTVVLILAIIALFLAMLIPSIVDNLISLMDNIGYYTDNLQESFDKWFGGDIAMEELIQSYVFGDNGLITKVGEIATKNLNRILEVTSSVGSVAGNILVGLIFAVYFLMAKESIKALFTQIASLCLSALEYYRARFILAKFNVIFSKYIICEIEDMVIVGVANYLFMLVTKMPDSMIISVVVAVTNLAPTFGPIIGAGIGALILVIVQPSAVIPFLVFTLVLQSIDGYVIKPKFFGGALDVPGVLILVSIVVFGKLMGIAGMLLAIPFAAIIAYVYMELFIPWLELKKDLSKYKKEMEELEKQEPEENVEDRQE